ncbi:MAG: DJ-1/PfpI family protein [Candidatus Aenigmarchaeota archaeon]|nr:DJ-1/PfpI family protein [Candidatus Aenigmarchaeota archaeon]
MGKVLMIIAPKNFRDEELFNTKEELESSGNDVTIASTATNTATGMLGGTVTPEMTIDEVNVDDYDAIVFVGGSGSSIYFNNSKAHEIAKNAHRKGKVIGAICIAPSTLANAGILKGKRATCWSSERGNLRAKGAIYTGNSVEKDGKIITADGPSSARNFGREIAKLL